ncbi:MAG: hypothetical protein QOG65_1196 [Actinomycetota bacterium]|nr:hypothetical protein [Actinomycetota bacterium]
MRKCGSCGYLLLGDGDDCGRCGALLPPVQTTAVGAGAVDSAAPPDAATPSQSPAAGPSRPPFGRLSIPPPVPAPAPTPGPADAYAAGSPPPPAAETRAPGMSVGPTDPVRPPRATRLGVIALVVAIACAAGFGAMHLHSDPLPAGTNAFVAGEGVTYTSPDGSFQVQLPHTPVLDTRAITLNSIPATVYTADTQADGYDVAVASIAFPDRLSSLQMQRALDAAFKERISVAGGTLERKDLTMRDKLPAVEGRFNRNGVHAHLLIVASASALVLIAVSAKSGTDRLYKALEASLIVG